MKKDQEYEVILGKSKERMVGEVREALGTGSSSGGVGGIGGTAAPGWWEMPGTGNFNRWRRRGEMFEVRYPKTKRDREREREREGRGKKGVRREGLKLYVSFFSLFSVVIDRLMFFFKNCTGLEYWIWKMSIDPNSSCLFVSSLTLNIIKCEIPLFGT
jgi:hypothetical protein